MTPNARPLDTPRPELLARALAVLVAAALGAAVAVWLRHVHTLALPAAEGVGRAPGALVESFDPDSQYHSRRVARALAEGAVAGSDPLLAWPSAGAPIPWPPYYDAALALVARARLTGAERAALPAPLSETAPSANSAPLTAPLSEAARAVAADTVARAPAWLAGCTALAAGLAAAHLARAARAGAALAGALVGALGVALSFAHLRYSYVGLGDHHTVVGALYVLFLALTARAVDPAASRGPRLSAVRGAVAGVLAGLMLGTWVASLALIAPIQVVLAWLVHRPNRGRAPAPIGLALFGASMHKTAVLTLLPAAFTSPWTDARPLDVVNLSWFHVAWFGIAWLGFAPAVFLHGSPARRAAAPLALAGLVVLVLAARSGAAEALAWASATDHFMASIAESQPFDSLARAAKWIGPGLLLGPPALVFLVLRRGERALPWVVAVAVTGLGALFQQRFAEALAAPLAVVVGAAVAALWERRGAQLGALALCAALAHVGTLRATAGRLAGPRSVTTEVTARHAALARLAGSLRAAQAGEPLGAVLAEWDHGHALEWWCEAPTLATNFGPYVGGSERFFDPWRFFLAVDDNEGEALLERREARYVLVTRDAERNLATALRALSRPALDEATWRATVLARLVANDRADAEAHPAYLKLCGAEPVRRDGEARPFVRLFERVAGARLAVQGEPGARVALRMRVDIAPDSLLWTATAVCDAAGRAVLRVPYSTAPGDGPYAETADLTVGGRQVPLAIPPSAVRAGDVVVAGG